MPLHTHKQAFLVYEDAPDQKGWFWCELGNTSITNWEQDGPFDSQEAAIKHAQERGYAVLEEE